MGLLYSVGLLSEVLGVLRAEILDLCSQRWEGDALLPVDLVI